MMGQYRANPPRYLGGIEVTAIRDYKSSESVLVHTGRTEAIDLPKSDVLQFITTDGDVISVRPSGTEPKIKFYCNVKLEAGKGSNYEQMNGRLDEKVDLIMKDLV